MQADLSAGCIEDKVLLDSYVVSNCILEIKFPLLSEIVKL